MRRRTRLVIVSAVTAAVLAMIVVLAWVVPAISARSSSETRFMKRASIDFAAHDSLSDGMAHVVQGQCSYRGVSRVISAEMEWERLSPDTLGYPSIVKNDKGGRADGRSYLFYAHHEVGSSIGCMVSSSPGGAFVRHPMGSDGRVLKSPLLPRGTSHFSSPCVCWSESAGTWLMYFHYYSNEWHRGMGHQRTALAMCDDLSQADWRILRGSDGGILDVIPVTFETWMNSQSTYHLIAAVGDRGFLGFLRGTGGHYTDGNWIQYPCALGLARSPDGITWIEHEGNPIIHQADGRNGLGGVYRPRSMSSSHGRLLLVWSESEPYDGKQRFRHAFAQVDGRLDPPVESRHLAPLFTHMGDGPFSCMRDGTHIYIFSGPWRHHFEFDPLSGDGSAHD